MNDSKIKEILQKYSDYPVGDIKTHHDPVQHGYVAVRANFPTINQTLDFVMYAPTGASWDEIIDSIEEVEFDTWPPESKTPPHNDNW